MADQTEQGQMIRISDVPSPYRQLCWKQNELMVRCDRSRLHTGMHSWEAAAWRELAQELVVAIENLKLPTKVLSDLLYHKLRYTPDSPASVQAALIELRVIESEVVLSKARSMGLEVKGCS